jgi:hypothetical protein
MQMIDEHVAVVVVVVRRVVVVVVVRRVVVVVVVVGPSDGSVVVVVPVVVVVVDEEDPGDEAEEDTEDGAAEPVVVVAPADGETGGIGSTAPSSDGSCAGRSSSVRAPNAKRVQVIAPTTAPTANRPCSRCRVDPMGVLRVSPATTGSWLVTLPQPDWVSHVRITRRVPGIHVRCIAEIAFADSRGRP